MINLIYFLIKFERKRRMKNGLPSLVIGFFVVFFGISVYSQAFDKVALATDIDTMMTNHYLKAYFPKIIDKKGGGVYMCFDRQFNSTSSNKNLDMESRHLFSSSMGSIMHPEYAGFREAADSIYTYLRDKMWDKTNGGSGLHAGSGGGTFGPGCDKYVYHNGFALVGLSAYYLATKDTMALYIAKSTWKWIESKAYDDVNGMYYGWLNTDGTLAGGDRSKNQDVLHHWIEGMAWLSIAWPANSPDSADRALLRKRVKESSDIFCSNKWVRGDGSIILGNNREMTSGSGTNDGLDAEDVYLFYFYYQAIDTVPPPFALENLKKVHAYVRGRSSPGKHFAGQWWPDAELLASYCSMGILFNAGDSYLEDCKKHWEFIKQAYFDPQYGGWYRDPGATNSGKGDEWQCTYHGYKCMLFCRNWLFESQKGWIDALKPSGAKQGAQVFQSHPQPKQSRYVLIANNGNRNIRQGAALYDLTGRSMDLKCIRSRLNSKNFTGVYIVNLPAGK